MNQFSLYSDVKTRLSAKKGVFFYIYKNIEKNRLEITSTVHRSIITCLKITKQHYIKI